MLIKQLRRSKKNRDAEGANKATIEKEATTTRATEDLIRQLKRTIDHEQQKRII
jgi:hypothetical protein